ncbi:hypothetical protein [Actinoplanes sp. NPDC049265]|uniref:hypothetical protein n=1 Tax=Actinoplanes sp. NPDC049265 TaxID=3363902 RepID=UPI00371F7211
MTNHNNHPKTELRNVRPTCPYVYFIGFQYIGSRGIGFANVEVSLAQPLAAIEAVHQVEATLREQGYNRALIMGYSLLRDESRTRGAR